MNFQSAIEEAVKTLLSVRVLENEFSEGADLLVATLKRGNKILVCGNGGSAADSMHFATELVCRFEKNRRHLPAICLNASASDLTAFSNDFSYDEVFSRQLEAFGSDGDLLIVMTTSGNSPNVVKALEVANSRGLKSLALLGRDGGACKGLASLELVVQSDSTARIQETHKLLIHCLCSAVDAAFL